MSLPNNDHLSRRYVFFYKVLSSVHNDLKMVQYRFKALNKRFQLSKSCVTSTLAAVNDAQNIDTRRGLPPGAVTL